MHACQVEVKIRLPDKAAYDTVARLLAPSLVATHEQVGRQRTRGSVLNLLLDRFCLIVPEAWCAEQKRRKILSVHAILVHRATAW